MKSIIKNILIKLFNPIAKRLGYAYAKNNLNHCEANKNSLLDTLFSNLNLLGYTPQHIVDVGANHGTWTRKALKYFPDAYYTLIEPQRWLKSSIDDLLEFNSKIEFVPVGVGSTEGVFAFTLAERDDSSSFTYTKEQADAHHYKQIEVSVKTLDILLSNSSKPFPDLIKIDAEGFDLEVLKGASMFLGKTEIILIEAGIGCKSIPNNILSVLNFMDTAGYRVFDLTDLNRPFTPPTLWLVELVFVKKGGILDAFTLK